MILKHLYELMILFRGDLPEAEVRKEIDSVKKELSSLGAENLEEEYWGRKNLAYKMGSEYSGYYAFIKMSLDGKSVASYKSRLVSSEKVLRRMITRVAGV